MFKIVEVASRRRLGWLLDEGVARRAGQRGRLDGRAVAPGPRHSDDGATTHAIELANREDKHLFMHAFPNVDNATSNAICRKLGFELLEACEFEFPKGHFMTCNDWRLDLPA
jgi:hypothetical protein